MSDSFDRRSFLSLAAAGAASLASTARANDVAADTSSPDAGAVATNRMPVPVGSKLAAVGDSIIGYNNYAGIPLDEHAGGAAQSFAYGFVEQALANDPLLNFDSWYQAGDVTKRNLDGANQGVFGDHLAWDRNGGGIIGRLPSILARRPAILLLQGGTNTIASGDPHAGSTRNDAEYCIARFEEGLDLCLHREVPVILTTIFPRGDWPAGDRRHGILEAVNDWIRKQKTRRGILGVVDPAETLGRSGQQDASLFFDDRVHLNQKGAALVGTRHLLPILQAVVERPRRGAERQAGGRELLPASQAMMQGADNAGNLFGTATGQVASGFTVSGIRDAATFTATKESAGGDGQWQVLDIVPTADASRGYGEGVLNLPSLRQSAIGDGRWFQARVLLEEVGEGLTCARLRVSLLAESGAKTQTVAMNTFSSNFEDLLPGDRRWWIISKPIFANGRVTRLDWSLQFFWKTSRRGFRVRIGNPGVFAVEDPRSAWASK